METAFFNGNFIPKNEVKISPDDRGFLFADGIYEVIRWYTGFFYDMEGHMSRLKRSLKEMRISWPESDSFPSVAAGLIERNDLKDKPSLVYLQVTRGTAVRTHAFPVQPVPATVYASARSLSINPGMADRGVRVSVTEDPRWNRCDIKSVSLLPNILSLQQAVESGFSECVFVRNGFITECSHSNIFLAGGNVLYTHPESGYILSGITRKNVIRLAREAGIDVRETPFPANRLNDITEAFITGTSFEITPVTAFDDFIVNRGRPGPLTELLRTKFREELDRMIA
ncbi:MAG TPA: aminotransferase class IV [Bacteroidales bacterium]|jgi:D-alanine transaminase|nr:aminotransferase class IV [Bacteroidales bacterium]HOS72375.1 aminotransferase class IV [Bacteroidales bacterium]HQH24309.1 aminotransferase class IV [Bacteroidales bacterium]HQJ81544.1 aminotransferase class IV [Bacteroidales bacterium]